MSDNFKHKRSKWTCFTTLLWLIFENHQKNVYFFNVKAVKIETLLNIIKLVFTDYYIRAFFLSSTDKDIIRKFWQKKQQSLVIGKQVWVHQWSAARQITHSLSTYRFYTVESFCRAWMIGKSCAFWNTSSIVQDENSVGIYFLKLHCHRKNYMKKKYSSECIEAWDYALPYLFSDIASFDVLTNHMCFLIFNSYESFIFF